MTTSYLNNCLFEPSRAVVRIILIIKKQLFTSGHKLGGPLARDNPEPGVVKEPLDTIWTEGMVHFVAEGSAILIQADVFFLKFRSAQFVKPKIEDELTLLQTQTRVF